jgi:hypothetical protein
MSDDWFMNDYSTYKRYIIEAKFKQEPTLEQQSQAVSELYQKLAERLDNKGSEVSDCSLVELLVCTKANPSIVSNALNIDWYPRIILRAMIESKFGNFSNAVIDLIEI